MSDSRAGNRRSKHATSTKSEMREHEVSSSSALIGKEHRKACHSSSKKISSRRDDRHEKSVHGAEKVRRKKEEGMSVDASMAADPNHRTSRRDHSRRESSRVDGTRSCRHCNGEETKHAKKDRGVDRSTGYDSMIRARSTSGRRTHKIKEEEHVSPSPSPSRTSLSSTIHDRKLDSKIRKSKSNIADYDYGNHNSSRRSKDLASRSKNKYSDYDYGNHSSRRRRRSKDLVTHQNNGSHRKRIRSRELQRNGSRTASRYHDDEEGRFEEAGHEKIKSIKKHREKSSRGHDLITPKTPSKRFDSSISKTGRHAYKNEEEQVVSSSSSASSYSSSSSPSSSLEHTKKLNSDSKHGKNKKKTSRQEKEVEVHHKSHGSKKKRTTDQTTYVGPSIFLDETGTFAHPMNLEGMRDHQSNESGLKGLKDKMAIVFHHHHHQHRHRHGRLVELLERLVGYVKKPEKEVDQRRRGSGSAQSSVHAKQHCFWWQRRGGVQVGRKRPVGVVLSGRRSVKMTTNTGVMRERRR